MATTTESPAAKDRTPLEWCHLTHQRVLGGSFMYRTLLEGVELVNASPGRVVARLTVGEQHVNSRGSVHGATSAAVVDWAGGMAVASTGREKTGVSTDIHVSYVGTARVGDVIEIEAEASKVGGTLAYTNIVIRTVGEGAHVVATGSHTKFVKV